MATSAATQGARPHSKPPFFTRLFTGVGVQVGVVVVVGLHEQAELYRAVAVPQPAVARVGKPVVAVLTVVVYVAQKANAEETAAGLWVGNNARRQLSALHFAPSTEFELRKRQVASRDELLNFMMRVVRSESGDFMSRFKQLKIEQACYCKETLRNYQIGESPNSAFYVPLMPGHSHCYERGSRFITAKNNEQTNKTKPLNNGMT